MNTVKNVIQATLEKIDSAERHKEWGFTFTLLSGVNDDTHLNREQKTILETKLARIQEGVYYTDFEKNSSWNLELQALEIATWINSCK